MSACQICANTHGNTLHEAREMMFGLRERFTYLECGACGCVQLLAPPADPSKYYPPNYYSFRPPSRWRRFLRDQWAAYAHDGRNPIGRVVSALFMEHFPMQAIRRAALPRSARLLDVGCGAGDFVLDLWHLGYRKASGLDPYIPADITHACGARIWKRAIEAAPEAPYDAITLIHSFEHMAEPARVLATLHTLLAPDGVALISIPIAGTYGWRHYRTNWVGLDAPRHLFLHTADSLAQLASRTGFRIEGMHPEATAGLFWASEQYAMDIPLLDARSHAVNRMKSPFSWRQLREFDRRARALNRDRDADAATFTLRRIDAPPARA